MASFNSITRGLRRMVTKLDSLRAKNDRKTGSKLISIDTLLDKVSGYQDDITALENESKQASNTAQKLKEIIGDPL